MSNGNKQQDLVAMLMALGNAYLDRGLFAEAVKKYYQLRELRFENKELITNLSKAYIGLKKIDAEALAVYQKAVQYSTENKEVYDTLATIFLKQGREDAMAVKIYKLALLHEAAISDRLRRHLTGFYFKQKAFLQCKEIAEALFAQGEPDPQSLVLYLRSCWNLGRYDDAIIRLKKLYDLSPEDAVLLRYLCITYLEKIYDAELRDTPVKLSFIDHALVDEFLKRREHFESLQDVFLYLEIQRCFFEAKYWRHLGPGLVTSADHASWNAGEAQWQHADCLETPSQLCGQGFDVQTQILQRLTAVNATEPEEQALAVANLEAPSAGKTLVVIEVCRFSALSKSYGPKHAAKVKDKLVEMVQELLSKNGDGQVWQTANGLLVVTPETIPAVAFSIELLNKLNRYNFVNEASESTHVAISIHRANADMNSDKRRAIADLSAAIKLAMVGDLHLSEKARVTYTKAFKKEDRIFLTDQALQQIERDKRFKHHPLGAIRFKYTNDAITAHEISWRNPIDDLSFGFIKKLGRFDLLAELNNRGVMRVFKAKDSGLQRFVILKVIQSEMFNSLPPTNQKKIEFYNRAKAQAQMSHPNITNIYEVDEDHGLTYFAREYVEGAPIDQVFRSGSTVDQDRLVTVLFHACKALQYGNRNGFVHGNLKPGNLMLTTEDQLKIADFIIPKQLFPDDQRAQAATEPRLYLAPEQIQGRNADARSDLFALGTIFYEIATQAHPFAGRTAAETRNAILHKSPAPPSQINPDVPEFLGSFLLRCLTKNPQERFQTMDEVVDLIKNQFENTLFSNFSLQIAQSRDSY